MGLLTQLSGHWWAWMGPMLWQSTLLVVVVSAIDFLIRRWAWPQVRYVLWLLVMVKLLVPPVWSSPTGVVPQLERQLTARVELPWAPVVREAVTPTSPQRPPDVAGAVTPPDERNTVATDDQRPAQSAKPAIGWKVYAFAVWLVGVLGFVVLLAARYAALRRWHDRERRGQTIPPWYYDLLVKTARRLGTGRLPAIVFSDRLLTPAVCGAVRPVMYLPRDYTEKLTPAEAEHVLLHEMAHLKRGDLWLHALGLFVQVVYWFNPFVALARKHMQHVCEICTDLTVAEVLRERTVGYRQTLLDTARRMLTESASPGLGLLGVFEEPFRLVARLRWLEKPTWHHRKAARATAAVAAAAMLAFVLPMAGGKERYAEAAAEAEVWNVNAGYSATVNPNGAWSYGWKAATAPTSGAHGSTDYGPFILFVQHGVRECSDEVDSWYVDIGAGQNPGVYHNPHDYALTCGFLVYPANSITFHPGPEGEQSVIRWTAPYTMKVKLSSLFTAIDSGYSLVQISQEGTELYTGGLSGFGATAEFTQTLAVQAGDVIDCALFPGSYLCNTVLADITMECVLEDKDDTSWGKSVEEPPEPGLEQESLQPPPVKIINQPNPFNPNTVIRYWLERTGGVSLKVFDLHGHEVCVLVNTVKSAGWNTVRWDGRDAAGRNVPTGEYFARMETESRSESCRMMLVR